MCCTHVILGFFTGLENEITTFNRKIVIYFQENVKQNWRHSLPNHIHSTNQTISNHWEQCVRLTNFI